MELQDPKTSKYAKTATSIGVTVLFLAVLYLGVGFLYPWLISLRSSSIPIANVPAVASVETSPPDDPPVEVTGVSDPPADIPVDPPEAPIPIVSNGPVYYGITTADLIDIGKYPDGPKLYNAIRNLGNVSTKGSREVRLTAFMAPTLNYYVYFVWPTAYEDGGIHSCASINRSPGPVGTVNCFSGSTVASSQDNITDFVHRLVPGYVNEKGEMVSYEIYRGHFTLSPGINYYYSSQ